jgi:hypothetical protein
MTHDFKGPKVEAQNWEHQVVEGTRLRICFPREER